MHLLPKFDNTAPALQLSSANVFSAPLGRVSLLDYAVGYMDVNSMSTATPHSTPSAFEQAMQMHSLLKDPSNWASVASIAIQNWRALITLLALNDYNDYGSAKRFSITA